MFLFIRTHGTADRERMLNAGSFTSPSSISCSSLQLYPRRELVRIRESLSLSKEIMERGVF